MLTDFWFADRLHAHDLAWLTIQAGSAARLLEVVTWVLDAHASIERRLLPLALRERTEQPIEIPAAAHQGAVTELETRLRHCVAFEGVTHWQLWAWLNEMVMGEIFPEPSSAAEFHHLIATARNVNRLLAAASTFRCGCPGKS